MGLSIGNVCLFKSKVNVKYKNNNIRKFFLADIFRPTSHATLAAATYSCPIF